ncbi:hypothetical protein PDE_07594 [Penicillium oxalicum 114-2]|uniref:OTU domain-containing protein n=1 Tax=Penicillium oxalicum (strain 114-2 / CGMCC 5302) TaxID=933388 RepID=S7ZQD9_PENO1|nr:hypothetical protein PDE_07594 [Penicillium oxalicum 114-2]
MSTLTHGGRIVPILTGHEQHHHELDSTPDPPRFLDSQPLQQSANPPLLDQRTHHDTMRHRKQVDHACLEMPCLKERGLFAVPTEGDGNCLYYSLSDQLFGNFLHGDEIRHQLADHMAGNKTYFMQFVVAEGGERRRPRRAAVSAYATRSAHSTAPSTEDKERRFMDMIASTRKNGEWGSSEHLQAFCQVYRVDINVYTMSGVQAFRDVNASCDESRDVVHVAFHDFKHYSSVRPVDGTHRGLMAKQLLQAPTPPCSQSDDSKPPVSDLECSDTKGETSDDKQVSLPNTPLSLEPENDQGITSVATTDPSVEGQSPNADLAVDVFPPWDIQSIQDGLGGRYDRDTIVDMLQKCRGDIDRAFAALLGEKDSALPEKPALPAPNFKPCLQASRESSPVSTGSKRSADDSDDSDDHTSAIRHGRPRKRMVSNLTLGVGISFRDDQNEVLALNLHMNGESEKAEKTEKSEKIKGTPLRESTTSDPPQEQSERPSENNPKGLRRSSRLSKARSA